MDSSSPGTTQLLLRVREGSREAFDSLFARTYDELRRLARRRLRGFQPGQTLDTTGLVHEAYLALVDQSRIELADRAHFLALASRALRFILINRAESRRAAKRGSGLAPVPLDDVDAAAGGMDPEALLALNEALDRLAAYDERLARLVECRFFGGLSYQEIAEATGLSVPTVKRDWTRAQGWLHRLLEPAAEEERP
jgi:RNA polymerase sigma factor (TIGR02999 family)